VNAYDQATGQLLATYYSEPAGWVGGGVWTTPATDGSSVFISTASANDYIPPPGDQYSLVKLDAVTLARTGIFHVPDATFPDLDFGSSPVLFHATIGGTDTPLVGACSKNGIFYALRRDTMRLVWQRTLGISTPYGQYACLSGGVFGGGLYVGGPQTTIGGQTVPGSVRSLDPATGAILWERPLVADPLGARRLGRARLQHDRLVAYQQRLLPPRGEHRARVAHDPESGQRTGVLTTRLGRRQAARRDVRLTRRVLVIGLQRVLQVASKRCCDGAPVAIGSIASSISTGLCLLMWPMSPLYTP
jgi:hypothetical protein